MRLLIIEDDETSGQLLAAHFGQKGYEVLVALHGEAGLELARAKSPDLVVLDIMVPGTDGWETCRRLRETSS